MTISIQKPDPGTACPENLWLPHPWKPGWMGFGTPGMVEAVSAKKTQSEATIIFLNLPFLWILL